jgi:signal transduction histidine kinase/CheY-like chemotaxis protein
MKGPDLRVHLQTSDGDLPASARVARARAARDPDAAARSGKAGLVVRLEQRVARERAVRREAQAALRARSDELVRLGAELRDLAARQDQLIAQRTKELRRARDEAVSASSAKSAFLANMSHEIRTPLTSIIGFGELLLSPALPADEKRDAVQTIIRNGRHLLEVINDILDLSKIETGQVQLETLAIDLPVLLRDLATLVAGRAQEKSLEFAIEPVLPLPARLASDPVRIKQILLNFCSNAIKFTARGSVRLTLAWDAARSELVFAVTDTGIGMSEEQVARLFQPFVQADVSTTRRFGGSGLGLYLSAQLATALGARIGVASEPGRGSRFSLHLPIDAPGADAPMLTVEGDLLAGDRPEFAVSDFAIPELAGKVLLAEDGPDNQRLLATYLKQAGLEATVVGNGRDAVEAALQCDFDLILMDIQMPVLDGVSATQMLRDAGYTRPIAALTANVMKSDLQRYRETGCDEVLAKPVDRERFYAVIAALLRSAPPRVSLEAEADFAREMAALAAQFRAGLPEQLDAIRDAMTRSEWPLLKRLLHTLKGTAGAYGFQRLTDLAAQAESELVAGRQGRVMLMCEGLILEARGALLNAAR